MANSVVFPRAQFFANNGRPLVGGRIHTYVAGSSTRASTYQDAANAQINTNPIILDARGEAAIYLAEGVEYKFVVEDSTGALIMTQEPVYGAVWDLAAATGASLVGFQQAGTGAVSTTVQSKLREFVSVKDFGAVGDGVTDDTAAIQAALTFAVTNKTRLHFPSGTYIVTSTLSAALAGGSVHISGDGRNVTRIALNTGGNGIELTLPGNWWFDVPGTWSTGIHISDLTFTTTNLTAGIGLKLTGASVAGRPGPSCHFSGVEWTGKNSFSQFWATAVQATDLGDMWFDSCRGVIGGPSNTTGKFLRVVGTAQATSPVSIRMTDPQIYYGGTQIELGDYVEGVYVTQPHMVAGQKGISWIPAVGESGLHLVGGHISSVQTAVELDDVFDLHILGTLIYREGTAANWRGVHLQNVGRLNIGAGAVFKGTNVADGETAIYVQSSVNDEKFGGLIAGNSFHSFATRAIWLGANANYIHIGENQYRQCAERVLNQSTNVTNSIAPKTYCVTVARALTGGATTENIDLPLPGGMFRVKPGAGLVTTDAGSVQQVSAAFDFTASSTTNARIVVRNPAGGNIAAGTYRFHVVIFEQAYSATH